jgi:cytoskeletal protein CcmA (bactofilin family)
MAETIIAQGITIDGEISGDEPVLIEGTVKGKITLSATVTVAEEGVVEADIETTEVQISGTLTGNVAANERVEIAPSGKVIGDIKAPRILIADGAGFKGHIDMDVE